MKTVAAPISCTSSYVVVIVKIASGAGGRLFLALAVKRFHKIIAQDMVLMLRSQSNTGANSFNCPAHWNHIERDLILRHTHDVPDPVIIESTDRYYTQVESNCLQVDILGSVACL